MSKPFVIIESPYKGNGYWQLWRNKRYLKRCIHDSLSRGEIPFASHGFYTRYLNDVIPEERELGIHCGLSIMERADYVVVYADYGHSNGMRLGLEAARKAGKQIVHRRIL